MPATPEDPTLKSGRREAIAALLCWGGAMTYTVGYCATHAYGRKVVDLTFVLGFPDWVFWGILLPWGTCYVIALWFSFSFMRDETLEENEPQDIMDLLE